MSAGALAYIDASAFVKLVVAEPESVALERELVHWPHAVSSELLEVEALRFALRWGGDVEATVSAGLASVTLVPVNARIRRLAGSLAPRELRSLDAIHLATAVAIADDVGALFAYDRRLADAAALTGLRVRAPS